MACGWQVEADSCVVGIRIAGVELVRDGFGEAVIAGFIALETGGLVDCFVGDEAGVGLGHERILVLVIGAAVRVRDEVGGQRRHQRLADWKRRGTGYIEGLGHEDGRAGSAEEGLAVLEEQGDWDAGLEGVIAEERVEEIWAGL